MPVPRPRSSGVKRQLLRDAVLEDVRDAILDGTLVPGERLRDDELESWLSVSRTPIRQALGRLAEAGLVEVVANRFTRVAQADPSRILEHLEIAVTMWQLAARFTLGSQTPADRVAVLAGFDAVTAACDAAEQGGDPGVVVTAVHDAFRALPDLAQNTVLSATLADAELGLTYQVGLTHAFFDYAQVRDAVRVVREAVLAGDAEGYAMACEGFLDGVGVTLVARAAQEAPPVELPPLAFPGRRLLVDVAYDALLAAITDGTLQADQRLNDAELSAWLGVSRTPLRQAIERLADEGFVVLEANRLTRVAPADPRTFVECSQVASALHRRAIVRELPGSSDQTVDDLVTLLDQVSVSAGRPDAPGASAEVVRGLRAVAEFFTVRSDSVQLRRVVDRLSARIAFLAEALGTPPDQDAVVRYVDGTRDAVVRRDAVEAARCLRRLAFGDSTSAGERTQP